MKSRILFLLVLVWFGISIQTATGQPPPPSASGGHGISGNQQAGSAPVGNGVVVLLSLALVYAAAKIYAQRRETEVI